MSPHDAPVDALIAAGWGNHKRHKIPADWQTNRGPDKWSDPLPAEPKPKVAVKRPRADRRPSGLPVWRQRRQKWLLETGQFERYQQEFGR